jgi:hypothetical protein
LWFTGYETGVMIREPDFGAEANEIYGEALDAMERADIHYMLGGAVALNAYTGIWRDTKDLDLLVLKRDVARVLETLQAAGFETEIEDPCWLAKARKGSLFADIIHGNHNAAVFVEESWFANAREAKVLGRRVLVVPIEELILSKIFIAFRDRWDASDVLHLVFATGGDLDWDRIVAGMGEHWEFLLAYLHIYRYVYPSHAHHLPRRVLELLRERYEEETEAAPEDSLRFRGTMLDDSSFEVDVELWGLPDERAANRRARCPEEERG